MPDGPLPICGNGRLDPGEGCDPGIAAGQPGACPTNCDDANTCTDDVLIGAGTCTAACQHTTLANCCGNDIVEGNEVCDDGNQADLDGCSHDCLPERAFAVESLVVPGVGVGCDLTGDGVVDNALSGAMNDAARAAYNDVVNRQDLQACTYALLLVLRGADPQTPSAPLQWMLQLGEGSESPPMPSGYFSGQERFLILRDGLDASGRPLQVFDASIGPPLVFPADGVKFALPFCLDAAGRVLMEYRRVNITGTIAGDPAQLTGRFCAVRTIGTWSRFRNVLQPVPLGNTTLLDVIVTGLNAFNYRVTPTQPDIDLDGDGLEHLMDTDGDGRVDRCIDGNGTIIDGTDCPLDPRMADGYSEAEDFTAATGKLGGLAP